MRIEVSWRFRSNALRCIYIYDGFCEQSSDGLQKFSMVSGEGPRKVTDGCEKLEPNVHIEVKGQRVKIKYIL